MKKRFVSLSFIIFCLVACSIRNTPVLKRVNNQANLHAEMAIAYLAQNNLSIALAESEQALKLNPGDIYVKYAAGLVNAAAGQSKKAQIFFEDVLFEFNSGHDALIKQSITQLHIFNYFWLNYAKFLCYVKDQRRKKNLLVVIRNYLSNFEDNKLISNNNFGAGNLSFINKVYALNQTNNFENLVRILKSSEEMLKQCI